MTKPTLVLLPGLICDAALWTHQSKALEGLFEIVIPGVSSDDDIARMATTILSRLPERFSLAGLSMGGYLALEMLRQVTGRIERLALLNTSARADTAIQSRRRRGLVALSGRGEFKGVTPRLLPRLIHASRLEEPVLVETISSMAKRIGQSGFVNQQSAILGRRDSLDLLTSIRCPTLVLCGREDQMTPLALSEEIASLVPGAVLVVIDNCGHLSALERSQETTHALRAWSQTP
jgi:pimeloyl-ACP methyl ester carboxylesterase